MGRWFRRWSLAAAFLAPFVYAAHAQDAGPDVEPALTAKPAASGAMKLQKTFLEHAVCAGASCPILTVNAYTPIDAGLTFKCTTDCVISATGTVQVFNNVSATRPWGVCIWIDGIVTEFGCPFQGYMPSDRSFVTGTLSESVSLTAGKHKVQAFVYSTTLGQLSIWNITYQLYQ